MALHQTICGNTESLEPPGEGDPNSLASVSTEVLDSHLQLLMEWEIRPHLILLNWT